MRKLLSIVFLLFMIPLSACTSSSFPLEIKLDQSMQQVKKGSDFRLYRHNKGYILIKSFESNQNSLALFNKLNDQKQDSLNSIFAIGSTAIDSNELGFNMKSYSFSDYRPIIVSDNNVYGIITEVKTQEDDKYREFLIFCLEGRAYYVYYISDIRNTMFYQFVKNISITNAQVGFSEDISSDITITGHLDLGEDQDGKPYFIIYKKKDQIARAARQESVDTERIGIIVQLNSNKKNIKEATIDAIVEKDGTIYKNDGNAYFNLEPQEICEYSLLLPIDKDMTKTDISQLIDAVKITLRYKEDDVEKVKILKEPRTKK